MVWFKLKKLQCADQFAKMVSVSDSVGGAPTFWVLSLLGSKILAIYDGLMAALDLIGASA